ncbi:hypothetical protein [Flavobacterium sp.]|uniref:hypothetical protein n=1 Tax=Flavobacterium sp. TaxID=239 RepID=UPI00261505EE|nr:hypothetical protein [Flavobacterium sp.]
MENRQINYKEFVRYVHDHFSDTTTLEEVEDILHLEDDYNKDSPNSLGKSLVIDRLIFKGEKKTGEIFMFDQPVQRGINIWIADNHKGKSTIFKVIKFALTGSDSIKKDIKHWITEIFLQFSIGKVVYTCYINRTGRDRGGVYRFSIDKFIELRENQKLDDVKKEIEFEFNNRNQFEEKIQDFFFEQFSFYTLKYTQKNSAKDSFEMNTSNLSWTTYFKSIYLESNNYEYLFFENEKYGAQGKKIFEMILGLPLTYPINMLNIQMDRVLEAIGKKKLFDKNKLEFTKSTKVQLEKRLSVVQLEQKALQEGQKIEFNERPLIEEYNKLSQKVNETRKQQRIITDTYQAVKNDLVALETEVQSLESDKGKVLLEITKLKKRELNIDIYRQSESFFTNLEIKTCPHCEKKVSEEKKKIEIEDRICSLCGEESKDQKIDPEEINEKAKLLKDERIKHEEKLEQIETTLRKLDGEIKRMRKKYTDEYAKFAILPSVETDSRRLTAIENEIETIGKQRTKFADLISKKESFIKEEAIILFQLNEISKQELQIDSTEMKRLNLKRDVLDYALQGLEKKRIQLNKDILNKLQELIINEIHAFGLNSINNLEISDKYELVFIQHGVPVSFSDLTEGEKLRVKLAFYLSLIQLDIEHNLGRHPRFLIFDSPGSEEMVPKHLQGLSDIFKSINDRFKDQLQIFVGSALRDFSNITDKEKTFIKKEDEFVF